MKALEFQTVKCTFFYKSLESVFKIYVDTFQEIFLDKIVVTFVNAIFFFWSKEYAKQSVARIFRRIRKIRGSNPDPPECTGMNIEKGNS